MIELCHMNVCHPYQFNFVQNRTLRYATPQRFLLTSCRPCAILCISFLFYVTSTFGSAHLVRAWRHIYRTAEWCTPKLANILKGELIYGT